MFVIGDEQNPGRFRVEDAIIAMILKGIGISRPFKFQFNGALRTTTYNLQYLKNEASILGGGRTRPLDDEMSDVMSRYNRAVGMTLHRRRIFVTANGQMGFGPEGLSPGDVIVVFDVSTTALGQTQAYKLMGECYLHGWMYGEAMQPQRICILAHKAKQQGSNLIRKDAAERGKSLDSVYWASRHVTVLPLVVVFVEVVDGHKDCYSLKSHPSGTDKDVPLYLV
ncbi:hypothetical protein B0I35DRAFT_411446 [Stachybotrys elegans]|uniref:Uncharacterized protein n=1 Tax=Stachybotrys elegans TaxID=80388 RepID=A0A8K0SIG4_9HYPO|nr:hypothetical protein B0I35DRAFT_411446 [Stachybotrys elegans]